MMHSLQEQPGLLYVVATLLPLASFVILLLLGGLRNAVRPYRGTGGLGATLFAMFGGDKPNRVGAYIATGAIALSFVCCAIGLVWFLRDHPLHSHESEHVQHAAEHKGGEKHDD